MRRLAPGHSTKASSTLTPLNPMPKNIAEPNDAVGPWALIGSLHSPDGQLDRARLRISGGMMRLYGPSYSPPSPHGESSKTSGGTTTEIVETCGTR